MSIASTNVDMQGEKTMLRDLLFEKAGLPWADRVIIYDTDGLVSRAAETDGLCWNEYVVYEVSCAEELRFIYERDCRQTKTCVIFIIPRLGIHIPYDISEQFTMVTLGLDAVFPKLDTATLRTSCNIDFDYLPAAVQFLNGRRLTAKQTKTFYTVDMFNQDVVDVYAMSATQELLMRVALCKTYHDRMPVIDLLSKLMLLRDKGFTVERIARDLQFSEFNFSRLDFSALFISRIVCRY